MMDSCTTLMMKTIKSGNHYVTFSEVPVIQNLKT